MKIIPLTIGRVEHVAHVLATLRLGWSEPIPPFNTRYPGRLESCLATPFQKFASHDLYPGFLHKAALLFYLMNKRHPFQNGNKRVAVTSLLVFLALNGKWVSVDAQQLYNFSIWVAESPADLQNDMVRGIATFLKKHIVALP